MLTKEIIIEAIKDMPDTFSVEDLLDKVLFLQKANLDMQQSEAAKIFSTEEAKLRFRKWLK